MEQYIGLDVHRKFSQVCVMDATGQVQQQRRLGHEDADQLVRFFEAFDRDTPVAMEATVSWMWLADLLGELGLDVHLAHPAGIKMIAASRLKTDKVDARTIAHLLRTELLPESYLAPPHVRHERLLLRYRQALVALQTKVKNHIHAVLMRLNLHLPGSDIFGVKGMAALRQLELPDAHGRVFQGWLDMLVFVREQLKRLEQELSKRLRTDRRAAWLQSLPGVGKILAHVMLAELGEVDRFPTDKHFASYAGTVPTTRQSGQHVHHGPAGYRCNPTLQWALVEAANVAVRRDSYFAQLYHKHNRSKGHGKAIVIVAHRMARILWHMLKEQRSYKPKVKTPVGSRKPLAAAAPRPSRAVQVSE